MSAILSACGMGMIGAFLSFILSSMGYSGSRLISTSAVITLLILAAGTVGDALSELAWIAETAGISGVAETALKVVGIGYVAGACYDVCIDMGERGIASAVLTVGRAEILLIIAPAVSEILKLAVGMI